MTKNFLVVLAVAAAFVSVSACASGRKYPAEALGGMAGTSEGMGGAGGHPSSGGSGGRGGADAAVGGQSNMAGAGGTGGGGGVPGPDRCMKTEGCCSDSDCAAPSGGSGKCTASVCSKVCPEGKVLCSDDVCRAECPGMAWLGDVYGGSFASCAVAVSADGNTVVGNGTSPGGGEGFVWKKGGSLVSLGSLPGRSGSSVRGISPSGALVIGSVGEDDVIWNPLIRNITSTTIARASLNAVNDAGMVVGDDGRSSAFSWTATGGYVTLPLSAAVAVSADGKIIAGGAIGLGGIPSAAVLVNGVLKLVPEGMSTAAVDLSGDGSFLAGLKSPSFPNFILWRHAEATYTDIDKAPYIYTHPRAVNHDGTAMIGSGSKELGGASDAVYWSPAAGLVPLSQILPSAAASIASSFEAKDISGDGKVVVGCATNADGNQEAVRVVLP